MDTFYAQGQCRIKLLDLFKMLYVLCSFHQLLLETQNRRIDDLVERIRLQQEKLDKQNVRIKTLQSQVKKQLRTKRVHLSASYFFFKLSFHISANL